MKKSNKKKLLSIFALALSCCAVSAVGALTASASDGATTVTVNDTAGNFYMADGAGVRMDKEKPGIRWTTNITEVYYNALVAEYGDDVRLATQVSIVKNNETKTQTIPCTVEVSYDANGVFTYYAALTFEKDETGVNGLTEAEIAEAKEWQITAQAVAIDNGADEDKTNDLVVQEAVANDTSRSMKAVANAAKLAGENKDGILDNYVGDATVGETTSFYDTSDTANTKVEVALDVDDGTYTDAYVGAKKVELTVADGKVSIDASTFVGVEAGDLGYVSIFTNDGIKATPVRFAHKFIKNNDDLNKVLINNTTITGYYVLANDIEVTSWSNTYKTAVETDGETTYEIIDFDETHTITNAKDSDADGKRTTHYGMVFNGTFDGNGHTITCAPLLTGVFGTLGGTVKNMRLVFNAATDFTATVQDSQNSLVVQTANSATVENLQVELNGETELLKSEFSLFGAGSYASMKNIVADLGDVVKAEQTTAGNAGYGLLTWQSVKVDAIANVYLISSTLKELATEVTTTTTDDGTTTTKTSVYAENETGENLTTVTGVRRYDSWSFMAGDSGHEISGFDSAWWDTTSGLPIWKATANMDGFVEWKINGAFSDSDSILLNNETKEARIYLSYGKYMERTPTLTATTDGIVEIDGNLITAVSDGMTEVVASWTTPNEDKTIEKTFTVTVAQTETWDGANLIFAPTTSDYYIDLPEAMGQETANITSIQNITDGATVFDGTTWTADALANTSNAVITKEIKIEFTDGTSYLAKMDCYTKAIASKDDMNAILIKNATTTGAYILVENINVDNWTNYSANGTANTVNHHYGTVFSGLFEGNGYTITAIPVACGLFGQLTGTVQNLNVVFEFTKNYDFSYPDRNALITSNGQGKGVIKNLNVKLTGTEDVVTTGISLFGSAFLSHASLASVENVVADFGNVVSDSLSQTSYGFLFAGTKASGNVEKMDYLKNVYVISPDLKELVVYDNLGTTATYYAENEAGQTSTITGVKRFDSWDNLTADEGFDVNNYDPTFWAQYYN